MNKIKNLTYNKICAIIILASKQIKHKLYEQKKTRSHPKHS